MKISLSLFFIIIEIMATNAQSLRLDEQIKFNLPDTILKKSVTSTESQSNVLELSMLDCIKTADKYYTIENLAEIINFCTKHGTKSPLISLELSNWLQENHPIYTGKSPSDVHQFRAFLMYALGQFPTNDNLLNYIKYELKFSDNNKNVAAAASTSKIFTTEGKELVELLTPFLQNSFTDAWIDITTYTLTYPPLNPTKVKYEIIETLKSFGPDAYSSIKYLKGIVEEENRRQVNQDSTLLKLSLQTIDTILKNTPICCRVETKKPSNAHQNSKMITKKNRQAINIEDLTVLDQEGDSIKFNKLIGKPFILTFFYTNCTNPLKCAATVDRLVKLQKIIIEQKIEQKVALFGMSYDADFDSPSVLKSYGHLYGLSFTKNVKFFSAQNNSEKAFLKQLNLRVNYGYGTVNQHGIQLFIVDKKGRISAVYDNEVWEPNEVLKNLVALARE